MHGTLSHKAMGSFFMFLKDVSYAHQGCIYLKYLFEILLPFKITFSIWIYFKI